jgi:transposase InsO family protein
LRLCLGEIVTHSFISPDSDEFVLTTDASKHAIGGVLHQVVGNEQKLIQFYSRKLSDVETRYSTFDRELLGAHDSLQFFLPYIEGCRTTLFTDHRPLTFALHKKGECKSDRQARQLSFLSEHLASLEYIKGDQNVVADFLSRKDSVAVSAVTIDTFDLESLVTAQKDDREIQQLVQNSAQFVPVTFKGFELICENSFSEPRPVVPLSQRRAVFDSLHCIGHGGVKASTALIKSRFFWPCMTGEIKEWCKQCLICQQMKVHRHTKSALTPLQEPTARFQTVHMDIVGPLPVTIDNSGGQSKYRYIVTFIDRYSRWMEAVPVAGISVEEVCGAFLEGWVSRFGVPLELITDRGGQFESDLFQQLSSVLGFIRIRTTAYHPQSNGLLERQHRQLKNILRAHGDKWLQNLPIALFAMRITPSESTQVAPFTLVTGANVLAPTRCFQTVTLKSRPKEFITRLSNQLESIKFVPPRWNSNKTTFIPAELSACKRVWVRIDRVRRPLEAPYAGPYEVIERNAKIFTVLLPSGKIDTISIDRIKPCVERSLNPDNKSIKVRLQRLKVPAVREDDLPLSQQEPSDSEDEIDADENLPNHVKFARRIPFQTKSGRTVHFSDRNSVKYISKYGRSQPVPKR